MESRIIVFLIWRQVDVIEILPILLVLFTIHVISWALIIILVITVLLVHAISGLVRLMVSDVTVFRRLLKILIVVVIHISKKLNYLYKALYLIF